MQITKIFVLLLCITVFLIPACSGADRGVRIAFIPGQITDAFYISVYEGVKRATDVLGVELIYEGSPEWDVAKQIAVLNKVIKQNPAVILISPTDTKKMIAPLSRAHKKGI